MKIAGVKPTKPKPIPIVIPLDRTQKLVFKCQAVLSFDEFDEVCPKPMPEKRDYGKDGGIKIMADAPEYLAELTKWSQLKMHWTIIKSLEATDGLEWDTVKMEDPSTWGNYEDELREIGLSDNYVDAIFGTAIEACGLSQAAIDEATDNFLASQAGQ